MTRLALVVGAAAWTACVASASVTPIRYSGPNGEGLAAGGAFNYWDETYSGVGSRTTDRAPLSGGIGQLADGVLGASAFWADLGNGPAHEWVAWTSIDPVLVFEFATPVNFSSLGLHTNGFPASSVQVLDSVRVSYSMDGVSFGGSNVYGTDSGQQAISGARWIAHNTPGTGRFVKLELTRHQGWWIFLSEIRFDGTPVPGPGALGALLGGAVLVERRRRGLGQGR